MHNISRECFLQLVKLGDYMLYCNTCNLKQWFPNLAEESPQAYQIIIYKRHYVFVLFKAPLRNYGVQSGFKHWSNCHSFSGTAFKSYCNLSLFWEWTELFFNQLKSVWWIRCLITNFNNTNFSQRIVRMLFLWVL